MLAAVALAAAAIGALFWLALTGSLSRPPAVAPLAPGARFSADVFLTHGDGYVAAGVVGTREPNADGRCSGRFALVELDAAGTARRAIVASGLEPDRWCANEVEVLLPYGDGDWLIGGVGRSESEPSFEDQGERGERLTLRISADGEPREDFGDNGILHRTVVVGRVQGTLLTDQLERVTEEGDIRGDVLVDAGSTASTWTDLFALGEEIVVAVGPFGRDLEFQTFAVDSPARKLRLRPLRPLRPDGADPDPGLSVPVGESAAPFSFSGAALGPGRLYVLRMTYQAPTVEPHVIAVDPRRWQLVAPFGSEGVVPLSGLVGAPTAFAVDHEGNVVAAGALDLRPVPGGLRVVRLVRDGLIDTGYGGTVHRAATVTPGVAQVAIDDDSRPVVLEASGTSLVRLTRAGTIDHTFGDGGGVDLGGIDVCGLEPGRFAEACSNR